MGHLLIVDVRTTHATGRAEREAAEAMIEAAARGRRSTLGADKAYDAAEHIARLRAIGVTPHVAQHTSGRRSAIDGRTTRHASLCDQRARVQADRGAVWLDQGRDRPAQDPASRATPCRLDRHSDGRSLQPGASAQGPGQRGMTKPRPSQVLGRWQIIEIKGWEADYVDLLGHGHLQLDPDGGHVEFGAVQIELECWYSPTGARFNFHGSEEGTEVWGDGDADLEPDGTLAGEVRLHHGDNMPFVARGRCISATC